MTPDALHALSHHPLTAMTVFCLGAAGPVLGWLLAVGLVGERHRAGRAAHCVGIAALALPLVVLGIRVAVLAMGSGLTTLLTPLGTPAAGWHPHDAVVFLVLPVAAAHLVLVELVAVMERFRPPRDLVVPLGLPVALLCLAAAALGSLAGVWSLQQTLTEIVAAEVFAVAPIALVAFAIWTRASDAVPRAADGASASAAVDAEHIDIPKRWTAVGALLKGARSFVKQAGTIDEEPSPGQDIWHAVGGSGGAPGVVDAFVRDGVPAGEAWQVGDLPAPTEQLVVTAAVESALRVHQGQVLVLTDDPQGRADALRSSRTSDGLQWPVGPVVAGVPALREALAEGKLPVATFLDTRDLSSGGIRALTRDASGRHWARTLGLVVLQGFDRGGPLAATHRVHTLRRLRLVLSQLGVAYGVLVTGGRSRSMRVLVQQAFPGIAVQDVPLRPRQTRALTVWLADYHFVMRSPAGWVKQAAEPVAKAGHRVRVSDPSGSFDDASLQVWDGDVERTPHFTLEGEASLGLLDAPALIAAWRALPHRVTAQGDRGRHHALWSLIDEPVTRYLLGEDRLARLTASEELPAPAVVAGLQNRLIARSHLRAALHEADQEHADLIAAYGPALVEEVTGGSTSAQFAVRAAPGGVVRTAVLARTPDDPGDPLGAVGKTTRVVDSETGDTLSVVDALTAPTRYYPRRVFARGGRRYAVPADSTGDRLEVDPVAPAVALTSPLLQIEVTSRQVREAEQRHTRGRFSYRASVHDVLAVETVKGARGSDGAEVEYAPVSARYLTTARVLSFDKQPSDRALAHLAASFQDTLRALILLGADDVQAVPVKQNWAEGVGPAIVLVERSVRGLGLAEVLDERRVAQVFDWVHAILSACACDRGCENCTPAVQVASGDVDKAAVIKLLTGA